MWNRLRAMFADLGPEGNQGRLGTLVFATLVALWLLVTAAVTIAHSAEDTPPPSPAYKIVIVVHFQGEDHKVANRRLFSDLVTCTAYRESETHIRQLIAWLAMHTQVDPETKLLSEPVCEPFEIGDPT